MTKTRSTKRALVLSALAILMCVSMLVGSTFAWFTDSVTSARNQIVSGNLDIELEYSTWDADTNTWSDYAEVNANTKIFDENALYEPGYTEVVRFQVKNAGSLALKYQMTATIYKETAGINVYNEPFNLSDYIYTGKVQADTVTDRASAAAAATEKLSAGLDMATGAELLPGASEEFALVLTMPTTVGNEANHIDGHQPSIEFGIALVATQLTHEEDSFDDQYDKDARYPALVSNATELKDALAADDDVILTDDIALDSIVVVPAGTKSIINLNGNKITTDYVDADGYSDAFRVLGDLTITNGTVEVTGESGYCFFVGDDTTAGKLTIEDGTYIASDCTVAQATNGELIINGGSFTAAEYNGAHEFTLNCIDASYNNGTATITVNGGTFYKFNPADNAAEGVGTNFVADGNKVVSKVIDGATWYTVSEEVVVTVDSAADFKSALANGDKIVLANDIALTSTLKTTKDVVIDLNGNTMTAPSSGNMFQSSSDTDPSITITSSTAGAEINVTGGNTSVVLGYGSTVISNVTINVEKAASSSYAPFKVYGDLTLGEGTVINVDYLGTSLISNNGAVAIVIDGAKINIGTFKTNAGAIISINQATTVEISDTEVTVGLDTTYTSYFVSQENKATITGCTFNVTGTNGVNYSLSATGKQWVAN